MMTLAGVTVSESTLTITEGGSGSYTVVLDTQPSGNVTITPSSNNTDVALSPTPLTFTSSNGIPRRRSPCALVRTLTRPTTAPASRTR